MFPGLILLIGSIFSLVYFQPPQIHNAHELAIYSKCEPEKIRYWFGSEFTYRLQGDKWDNSTTCIERKWGDCKCIGMISYDTLLECEGYSPYVACIRKNATTAHCVTYFTSPNGRRGFIDGDSQTKTFPPDTPWKDITQEIGGGPWITP